MVKYTLQRLMHFLGATTRDPLWDIELNHLRIDSRQVDANDVFIAIKGLTVDGREFIPKAIDKGAVVILTQTMNLQEDLTITHIESENKRALQVSVYNLAARLSLIANDFYHAPSKQLSVIGVTGTNGKTTITQLIAQLATLLNKKSAVLGTIGNGLYNQLTPSVNTTSSAVDIQCLLNDFVNQNVDLVAMEISSHGLVMNRVNGVSCSATVFSNLSRDHLDYHKSMENYAQAKWSLFDPDKNNRLIHHSGKSIINYDDELGRQWINKLDKPTIVSTQAAKLSNIKNQGLPYLCASDISYHEKGAIIHIDSTWGNALVESQLLGEFNVSNMLLTIATLLTLDFPFDEVTKNAARLTPICGRMEVIHTPNHPVVIVDYAHTPDALQKALEATRIHCAGKLWVIFGCGGDRDRGKRPLMGQVAKRYADNIILTNDNPRTEDEMSIILDIEQGILQHNEVNIIVDRAKAIEFAFEQASENDIILIAGKGHEDYQIIGNTKHYYSDQETVKKLMNKLTLEDKG